MGDVARQLAARTTRHRYSEDDARDADEVEDLLLVNPRFIDTARNAAGRFRRSVSVELEREGALPESSTSSSLKGKEKAREPPIEEEQETEERCCRMCLEGDGETDDDGQSLGPLIAPCACKGSVKWVHARCLYRWRSTSSSPASANTCGQCSFRYRLKAPWGGAALVWALNCQPLRAMLAIVTVGAAALLSGFITLYALKATSHVPVVKDVMLWTLKDPAPSYRITLMDDEPTIRVQHALFGPYYDPFYRPSLESEALARASIDAFDLVQRVKRNDSVWYDISAVNKTAQESNSKRIDKISHFASRMAIRPYVIFTETFSKVWKGARTTPIVTSNGEASSGSSSRDDDTRHQQLPSELAQSIVHAVYAADPSSDDPLIRSGGSVRGLREVTIEHTFPPLESLGDPQSSVLVRYLPENWGFFRYLFFGFYVYIRYNLKAMLHVFRRLFIGLTRASVGVMMAYSSKRGAIELGWLGAKVAVSALLAYLQEDLQAAKTLPALIPGAIQPPARSPGRILAGYANLIIAHASTAVFGPYWVNWWGGYPVSMYLKPAATSWSLLESLVFMQHVSGPSWPMIVDAVAGIFATFSGTAQWFRQRYTQGWLDADWTRHDESASEGYRRLMAGLLGDERRTKPSRYDLFLARRGGRLLVGRIRPVEMASLATEAQHNWLSYLTLLLTLGTLVVTAVAVLWAVSWAFHELLRVFFAQINHTLRHLVHLVVEHEWVRGLRAAVASMRRETPGRVRRGIRARLDPMLGEGTPGPEIDPNAQQQPAENRRNARAVAGANLEFNMGDLAVGLAVGPPANPFAPPLTPDGRPPSRWSLVVADLMSIYGSCQVILHVLRSVARATPFTPFIVVYSRFRELERRLRVQRDVVDLSDRNVA